MRIRALLFIAALAATAMMGIVASGASAATLFTTSAHTTRVTVGATGDAINTATINLTSSGTVANRCEASTLHFNVTENTDARSSLRVTGGSVTGCDSPVTPTFPWTVTISGTGTTVAPNRVYTSAIDGVAFDLFGILFTGNLTTGVTVSQPTAAGAPISINLASAGTVAGGGVSGSIDGGYRLEGAAASWSLLG